MQATAVIPTGNNIIRGLQSESAVDQNLEMLKHHYAQYGLPPIIGHIPVTPGLTPKGKHADYIVQMQDGAGIVEVPLQVKSSERCAQIFRKKCKKHGWGEIPTVVVTPRERVLDYSMSLVRRIAELLIVGFKIFRRKLCAHIAQRRNHALKKKRYVRESFHPVVRIHSWRPRLT